MNERDNVLVSELPPPPPPPPGAGASVGTTTSDGGVSSGWDWDNAKDLAERWYRPLAAADGWLALWFLFASTLFSVFLFVAMVALTAITFGLSFIVVGLFLIIPVFAAISAFTDVERWLASTAGLDIGRRPTRPISGSGLGAAMRTVSDPERWRMFGFIAANIVIAPVLFMVGAFPLSIVTQVLFGSSWTGAPGVAGLGTTGLLALPIAIVAAGAIPRVAIWTAKVKADIDGWFIGPDRLAAAERRVTTLAAQRQDVLDAVASERRRIERNLHDGVQQQLVAIGLDLGMATNHIDDDPERARELIVSAREKVQGSIGELRQLGRGLHPAILEDRGIDAALSAIVSGSPIPISVQVDRDLSLSTDLAETVYFVANEAIANVLKHAGARVASVHVTDLGDRIRVTVHDDGVGGANIGGGTGLAGMRARVNAVDGAVTITSPTGGPTTVVAEVPR